MPDAGCLVKSYIRTHSYKIRKINYVVSISNHKNKTNKHQRRCREDKKQKEIAIKRRIWHKKALKITFSIR